VCVCVCVCVKKVGYHLWWPLWKPTLSAAMSKNLRPSLPDCARYPRLRSMPQVVRVLGPLLLDCDVLHGVVGGVLVGGLGLWVELEAAEVVGVRQRKEGGSYLDEVSGVHFPGHSHAFWARLRILALPECTCGARLACEMMAFRMKPKLSCQAVAGAESGGTMPATMSVAAATLCCTKTAVMAATACMCLS
jgi:hypothetical protein